MKRLLIQADDLTGAADCAARCRYAGLTATVALRPTVGGSADGVYAFSSETRWLSPDAAAERVRALTSAFQTPHTRWYKKIDSTLRGNIGAELDAMLDVLGLATAIVCPAFPAQGRGLRDGRLVAPPPIAAVDLPELLMQQARRPVAAIGLADVRAGADALAKRLAEASRSAALLVCDALSAEDLDAVLEAAERTTPDALLCGSAGLIGALAARIAAPRADALSFRPADGPALVVVGSGSPMAQRQVAQLRRLAEFKALVLGERLPAAIAGDTLLHLPSPPPDARLDGPEARALAERLAQEARLLFERLRPGLLVLVGGDTAAAVLEQLGVAQLTIQRELLPGMPLARSEVGPDGALDIVLKSGNHGDEAVLETLVRLARTTV